MTRERFIELVKVEQHSLRRYLLALCCSDGALADDIAQETLLKAYLSLEKYSEQNQFAPWLFRIAYNAFIDNQRRHRPTASIELAQWLANEQQSDAAFQYQELYAALDQLPLSERSALLLFYIRGFSIREIAEIVGSTQNAVKKQLSRGREELRKRMKS